MMSLRLMGVVCHCMDSRSKRVWLGGCSGLDSHEDAV